MAQPISSLAPVRTDILKHRVWRSIDELRQTLSWTHQEMANALSLSPRAYHKNRTQGRALQASSTFQLASQLKLDPEALSLGEIDFTAFRKQYCGNHSFLPEKYSQGAFSRRRTSLPLLDFCDQEFGPALTRSLLRKVQVHRIVFDDPNAFINIRFLMDACAYLEQYGYHSDVYFRFGTHSAIINRESEIGRALASCESVKDAYDLQINHRMHLFEKNCDYHTHQLSKTHCIIESRERVEVLDSLRTKHIGSPLTCRVRTGVASAIATFLNVPMAQTVETHCVHHGDPYCRFHVNFEFAQFIHQKQARRAASSS